jgi:hypothetical protein
MTRSSAVRAHPRSATRLRFKEWAPALACILAIVSTTLAGGCDSGGTECQCEPTGLLLQICPEVAGSVKAIQLSGSACTGARLTAVDAGSEAGGAKTYAIEPTMAGTCGVLVSFDDGLTFAADQSPGGLVVVPGPGCCSGLYPNGPREIVACVDASTVDATDGEVPSDAPSGS